MPDLEVAVIGGGLSGLTAAAFVARAGRAVGVFEKAAALGGRARTRDESGFLFNLGPHALFRAGEAMAVLCELGVPVSGRVPPVAGGYAIRAGRRHTLPVGAFSLMTTGLLPIASKLEAGRLLSRLGHLRTSAHDGVSLADWLRATIRHPDVRDVLAAFVRLATYAHAPARQSAGAALAQLQRSHGGVLYLDGGWQTLVDGLRQRLAATDVVVSCRAAAAEIDAGAGAPFRLRLRDGGVVRARSVIVTAPPAETSALLGPLAPEARRYGGDAEPVRAACLDLALRRLPRPVARFALGIDEPLYASVHSGAALLAPADGAVLHLARYLDANDALDAGGVEQRLEELAEWLQPGWRHELVAKRFLPELVVSNSLVRAARGGAAGRPGPSVPGLPGAFVAGDWVGPLGMLADAAMASAREAARLAVAHLAAARRVA
jgi:phytoene dehydrogenase-like protein